MDYGRTFWWENAEVDEDSGVHREVFPWVQELEENQYEIHQANLDWARLYSNRELQAFEWCGGINAVSHAPQRRLVDNLVQSVCDTATSMIAKHQPKPTLVPRDASWSMHRATQLADQYLYGEFQHLDIYEKTRRVFLDACVFGTGVLKITAADDGLSGRKEICVERIMPDEIIVDQTECISTLQPMQIHHRKVVSRAWLKQVILSSKKGSKRDRQRIAELIDEAPSFYTDYRSPGPELIVVIDSYKLPSAPGAGDGRHTITIPNATLLNEPYERMDFPFVFFRWSLPLSGFYGQGLAEGVFGYQARLNTLNDNIYKAQDLMCVPRLWFGAGTGLIKDRLDTRIGRILQGRGPAPEPLIWPGASPELYREREVIWENAYRFAGISQHAAQATVPAQFESAPAQREFARKELGRFSIQELRWESFHLDIAKHILWWSHKLYAEEKRDPARSWRSGDYTKMINWSDFGDMVTESDYTITVEASSLLNMTPAGRRAQVDEWAQAGVITPAEYKALIGHPDIESELSLTIAAQKNIDFVIEKLEDGEFPVPTPLMDLQSAIPRVHQAYLRAVNLGAPDEIQENLLEWVETADAVLNPEPPQPAPMPGAQPAVDPMTGQPMPGGPPGMPGAPPPMGPGMGPGDPTMGPEGPLPAVPTTTQGTPLTALG